MKKQKQTHIQEAKPEPQLKEKRESEFSLKSSSKERQQYQEPKPEQEHEQVNEKQIVKEKQPKEKTFSFFSSSKPSKISSSKPIKINEPKTPKSRRIKTSADQVVLDLNLLATGKMQLVNVLKGSADKISCLLDIDGTQYVVKASSPYIEDHIINSHLFNLLSIPGVHAPSVTKLSSDFVGRLLSLSGSLEENDLFTALKGGNNQLAAKAPGYSIEDIQGDLTNELDLLQGIVQAKDAEKSLLTLFNGLNQPGNVKKDDWMILKADFSNAKNSKQRQDAIDAMKQVVKSPAAQTKLSVMGRLAAGGMKGVKQRLSQVQSQLQDLATGREVLNRQMATKEGAYALGALCAVDLLCGMDDRILSKWNGGNFMFDPETGDLWCIDNAKNSDLGLLTGKESGPGSWGEFVTNLKGVSKMDQLNKMIFFYAYGGGASGEGGFHNLIPDERKQEIEAAIGAAVEYTLAKVRKLVESEGLDQGVRFKLSKRLDFLEGKADIVNDESSSEGQTVSLSTSSIITSPRRPNRKPLLELSETEQLALRDAKSKSAKKPIREKGSTQITSTTMSISTNVSSSPKLSSRPKLSVLSEPKTISTTSILTSPRPDTAQDVMVRRPPRLKRGVFQEIGELTTGPRLGLHSTQPQTEESLIAEAQSIWGNEQLPSDTESQEKIISTMEKVEKDPNADRIDIIRRLSVELKINHSDLPESSKGLGTQPTSGETKRDSSEHS